MTPAQEQGLTRAVYHWLVFQQLCGRDVLFSESYLSQPVGEYVLMHHHGAVKLELNHPSFIAMAPGRPKQVDFALLTPNSSDTESVIEVKWVRDRPYSKQAVIDDLLRLECFRDPNRHVARYFLVAGRKGHFDSNFRSLQSNVGGARKAFTQELLSFDKHDATAMVEVFEAEDHIKDLLAKFAKKYSPTMPRRFKTKLVSSTSGKKSVSVYLWKVESNKNRATFDWGDV